MKLLDKMERRFGRYAITNLPAIIIALYCAGYLLEIFMPSLVSYCTLDPYYILKGQIWRVVTWIVVPPSGISIFTLIMLYFYFSVGKVLERTWGAFRFNVYIFSGILFTVLGAFLLYLIYYLKDGVFYYGFGNYFSTYYINMSILLAFTMSYPDTQVLLYFLIPIKMKWMGLLYGAFLIYDMVIGGWPTRVAILASLLNFLIYMASLRDMKRYTPHEIHRRQEFRQAVKKAQPRSTASGTIHRCVICGRTEQDAPNLEFRFCSKCAGNQEYCQDHLFTHNHIQF